MQKRRMTSEEWKRSTDAERMFEELYCEHRLKPKALVRLTCSIAEAALPIFERMFPTDRRPRLCIAESKEWEQASTTQHHGVHGLIGEARKAGVEASGTGSKAGERAACAAFSAASAGEAVMSACENSRRRALNLDADAEYGAAEMAFDYARDAGVKDEVLAAALRATFPRTM